VGKKERGNMEHLRRYLLTDGQEWGFSMRASTRNGGPKKNQPIQWKENLGKIEHD